MGKPRPFIQIIVVYLLSDNHTLDQKPWISNSFPHSYRELRGEIEPERIYHQSLKNIRTMIMMTE